MSKDHLTQNHLTLEVNETTQISQILKQFESSEKDLILVDQKTIITEPHMELLTDYPRTVTSALVARISDGNLQVSQGRIISASSGFHRAEAGNRDFVGVIRLSQKQREEILLILRSIEKTPLAGDAIDLLLVALIRARVVISSVSIAGAPWIRSNNSQERADIKAQIAKLHDGRLRLKLANRSQDGFFSAFFLRKFSKPLTWLSVKLGITPNQITLISFAIGLYSAYSFSKGDFWSIFLGAFLLQVSIIVDCVDGELARYTRKFSNLGAWLDAVTDRVKEYLVFFGLAYGAARNGRDLWIPAMAMMLLQTFRHLSDYNFARAKKERTPELKVLSFDIALDGQIKVEKNPKGRLRYWAGKVIQFPIGERWLVISVSAIIGGAGFTFTIMPILALISIGFVFRSRIRFTKLWSKERTSSSLITPQLDLWRIKESFTSRAQWLEPSILRVIEGTILISIFISQEIPSESAFLLLFAIIFHHYDNMYRALQGQSKPKWLNAAGLYLGGRILIIGIFAIAGIPMTALTWYFLVLFTGISSAQWILYLQQMKKAA